MNKSELKNSLGKYFGREIASDFRVLKEREIALCNDAVKFPFEGDSGLLREFCIFAEGSSGDLWLLSSSGEIAFYDHDLEFLSEANLKKIRSKSCGLAKDRRAFLQI